MNTVRFAAFFLKRVQPLLQSSGSGSLKWLKSGNSRRTRDSVLLIQVRLLFTQPQSLPLIQINLELVDCPPVSVGCTHHDQMAMLQVSVTQIIQITALIPLSIMVPMTVFDPRHPWMQLSPLQLGIPA